MQRFSKLVKFYWIFLRFNNGGRLKERFVILKRFLTFKYKSNNLSHGETTTMVVGTSDGWKCAYGAKNMFDGLLHFKKQFDQVLIIILLELQQNVI